MSEKIRIARDLTLIAAAGLWFCLNAFGMLSAGIKGFIYRMRMTKGAKKN